MQVTFFQRKPRSTGNYSIESVFDGVRRELDGRVDFRVWESPCFSNGVLRRLWMMWSARRNQGQVNHVTGDINFVALTLDRRRTVLTSHDCGFLNGTRGVKRWLLRQLWVQGPVTRVAAVTAVSAPSKDEIVKLTGCRPEKVHVIPNAVPAGFHPASKAFDESRPRILHVGITPNKNLRRLIEAVAPIRCALVVVGELPADLREMLVRNGTLFENYVNLSAAELVRQYELCDIVAFASLYEGFGLPILEGQAVGRPVITSDRRPMSDVAGAGACLVNPEDIEGIRTAILKVAHDAAYREKLIAAGFENIKRFAPDRVAELYLELYQQVLTAAEGR